MEQEATVAAEIVTTTDEVVETEAEAEEETHTIRTRSMVVEVTPRSLTHLHLTDTERIQEATIGDAEVEATKRDTDQCQVHKPSPNY